MTVDLDALEAQARAATHDGAVVVMAIDPRDVLALIARVRQLEQCNAAKATRIAELLAAALDWTERSAALVAEVGTLKARVAELERERP